MNGVIEVREVYKSFKKVQAVRGIDLSIPTGQFVALLGPNGAGKTTLVEMIEGIQKPDSGEILILGKKWKGNEDQLHQVIGLSLQETYFIDKLTVWETLKLFASFFKLGNNRCQDIIEIIGLEEKKKAYVVHLSGGQRQRLAIGIALLNNPMILLLDEPTTGLDPLARREIWKILLDIKKEKRTSLILTTHYMEEAEQLCDYIIIMDNGKVLKEGKLDELLNDPSNKNNISFSGEQTLSLIDDNISTDHFSISWDDVSGTGNAMLSEWDKDLPAFISFLQQRDFKLKSLVLKRKNLDDLFTNLTGRHLDE